MSDGDYVQQNARALARLEGVAARLSDDDLARPLDGGWTVATALAHLWFWEARARVLLERWRGTAVAPSPVDDDAINGAGLSQWLVLPPREVVSELLAVSREVDAMVAALDGATAAAIAATPDTIDLARASHRGEHLDQVERALDR